MKRMSDEEFEKLGAMEDLRVEARRARERELQLQKGIQDMADVFRELATHFPRNIQQQAAPYLDQLKDIFG